MRELELIILDGNIISICILQIKAVTTPLLRISSVSYKFSFILVIGTWQILLDTLYVYIKYKISKKNWEIVRKHCE